MKLLLAEIVVDPRIQIRHGIVEDTVRRYMDAFGALPPVDVFDTADGYLLSDGFHRHEAAVRLGLDGLLVTLHTGTREDALEHAATANLTHGQPLDREERNDAIRRLLGASGWTQERISQRFGVTQATVSQLRTADRVRAVTVEPMRQPHFISADKDEDDDGLTDSHYAEISRAPKDDWQPLVEAAAEGGWDRDETREAVGIIKDPSVQEADKRALLDGHADLDEFDDDHRRHPPEPLPERCGACSYRHPSGAPCLMPSAPTGPTFGDIKRELVAEMAPHELAHRLKGLIYTIRLADRWDRRTLLDGVAAADPLEVVAGLTECADWLNDLAAALRAARPSLEVMRP